MRHPVSNFCCPALLCLSFVLACSEENAATPPPVMNPIGMSAGGTANTEQSPSASAPNQSSTAQGTTGPTTSSPPANTTLPSTTMMPTSTATLTSTPSSEPEPTTPPPALDPNPKPTTTATTTAPTSTANPTPTASETSTGGSGDPPEPMVSASVSMMPTTPAAGEPEPSAGCGAGGGGKPTISNSLVSVPPSYDGTTPVPVVIAFHANGNPNSQLQGIFGDKLGDTFMLVYPSGGGDNSWQYPGDKASGFDAPMADVLAKSCVDTNRIYAIGHSGGAQFVTQLLCNGEDRFRAVAPVASSKYCEGWDAVPALVIHGLNDQERGPKYNINDADGKIDFGIYSTSNGCTGEGTPFEPMDTGCPGSVNPGCLQYDDCTTATQFCNHDDPQYSNTNHGVPCFAPTVVFDFFESQK